MWLVEFSLFSTCVTYITVENKFKKNKNAQFDDKLRFACEDWMRDVDGLLKSWQVISLSIKTLLHVGVYETHRLQLS